MTDGPPAAPGGAQPHNPLIVLCAPEHADVFSMKRVAAASGEGASVVPLAHAHLASLPAPT